MKVFIGRTSGPSTDAESSSHFHETEIGVVKDVIGMVNLVANNKEKWYVRVEGEGEGEETTTIPVVGG